MFTSYIRSAVRGQLRLGRYSHRFSLEMGEASNTVQL